MRCRIHPSAAGAGAGVCACCLRDRLSALSVAPVESLPDFVDQRRTDQGSDGGGRKSCAVKFSILNPLWGRTGPKKVEINDGVLKPSVSNVRFSALIRPKKTKKSTSIQPAAEDEIRGRSRRMHKAPISGRGMSPASGDETDDVAPSPLKRKVVAAQQNPSSVSSFAMCLNPMVRPGYGHRRSHGSVQTVVAGELRGTIARRCGGGGAAPDPSSVIGPNRSRKLVDLGKTW